MKRLSTARILCHLALIGSLFAVQAMSAEPERFALVIGNAKYEGTFNPLKNPTHDAEAIADALKKLGFQKNHVYLYENLDRNAFWQARSDFEQQLHQHPNSIALVYFSGHGLQGSDGKNYLIPTNAQIKYHEDVDEQGVAIAKILEDINANQPQMTILIVDACRNAVNLESRQTKGTNIKGTMKAMNGAAGSLIAFAASPDQYARDYVGNNDAHSPYTTALLENLNQPGLDIETVFKETRKRVLELTDGKQIPTETSLLVGDFYFLPISTPHSTTPLPTPITQDPTKGRLEAMATAMLAIYNTQGSSKPYYQNQCLQELDFWRTQAESNQPIAQTLLGGCYDFGIAVFQSDTEAMAWYRKAADQGYANAQNILGTKYAEAQNNAEAIAWYIKAANQGQMFAQTNLAWMYAEGKGVAQNDAEAVAWYRKAAEQGGIYAQTNLGTRYAEGKGVTQSDAQAVAWYRKAAEQGGVYAQTNLGTKYAKGQGVRQNNTQAAAWYRKAAEQNNATAQFNLGVMYQYGKGVPQSNTEAVALYRKAAEQGDANAQNNLGWMYEHGKGVPQSNTNAIFWYRKATAQGDKDAQKYLDKLLAKTP